MTGFIGSDFAPDPERLFNDWPARPSRDPFFQPEIARMVAMQDFLDDDGSDWQGWSHERRAA